ncbi:MAG: aminoacyl-tRNA hydrolase [Bacillota bacterium]
MWLIIGLGNPGERYAGTRHNLGFLVVNRLAADLAVKFTRQGQSLVAAGRLGETPVVLAKPLTFMNLSGQAVHRLLVQHRLTPDELTVVHDDLDLPAGRLRFKRGGGSGGHRGVASLVTELGTADFIRLKLGIGRPPLGVDPADFVLQPLAEANLALYGLQTARAVDALKTMLAQGLAVAMERYHAHDPACGEGDADGSPA